MARPLRMEYEGAFYHIIQRGIERKNIFISDEDKERLLDYFKSAHTTYNAVFHAYILMNNHYHFILETPRANLSKIMHYINTSYAAYFNAKHKRVGPLYQGRFKAILVQQDEYLHHLSRYVHLNPVRIGIAKYPQEYRWSSYSCFTSNRKPPEWLSINFILSMFDDKSLPHAKSLYKKFVLDGIGEEKEIIRENTQKGLVLGSPGFVEFIRTKLIGREEEPEIAGLKVLKEKDTPTLEEIRGAVAKNVSNNNRLRRKLGIYLSRKYTPKTLNEIAAFYGKIRYPGISKIFTRTEEVRRKDRELDRLLSNLEKKIMSNVKT